MPSLRTIRRRIRSVRSISQVTKAMEMVSASKMRRAQSRVLASRPYSEHIQALIADLAARPGPDAAVHPLLQQRASRSRVGFVVITADRGLCGALNSNVIRRAAADMLASGGPATSEVITVGRRAQDYMVRRGVRLEATFTQPGDYPGIAKVQPIAKIIMDEFTSGDIDAAYIVFPKFINTLTQRVAVEQILPVVPAKVTGGQPEYIFEPSIPEILGALLPRYIEVQLYQALLETIASEHSARMIAMRNATDNAKELISTLTLSYNKARQAAITREITEIAVGSGALGR
ncbi:MAG TPA: ATP synthase F1 subunit gamma [Chloroflexota bacterium]